MTDKDNEIIKKYNDMPNLQSTKLDSNQKEGLILAGVALILVAVGVILLSSVGYETASVQDYKNNIIQNVKTLEDCDRLILIDTMLSRYESMTEPTRKAVNNRMTELDC
ncbi:MAG TPA: hypothetical protein HA319_04240 [Nitrosopumilaceae archaeon]|nr:hypothetical protein [Nitrosopumilaceae archaeon]